MMKNKGIIIIVSCLYLLIAGMCYSCSYRKDPGQEIMLTSSESNQDDESIDMEPGSEDKPLMYTDIQQDYGDDSLDKESIVYAHICGAVVNPGVYEIKAKSRLVDLIELAGGLSDNAAGDYINQAVIVEDGQRIYIPTKEELKQLSLTEYINGEESPKSDSKSINIKVNINRADETELMSLPGIGQSKAKSIVEYRNKYGSFKQISDLMMVPGIKEGLFSKVKDLITVK